MKNIIIVLLCSCIALTAGGALTSEGKQESSFPVGFDTTLFHVTANFPAPAHKLAQKHAGDYLFAADKSVKATKDQASVEETYSLLYQRLLTGTKADDVADQFIEVLGAKPNVQVKQLKVATLPSPLKMDERYRAVEVIEGKRTDYYVFRVISTGDGVIVAVRTIQRGDSPLTDLSDPAVWQFVDSVNLQELKPS